LRRLASLATVCAALFLSPLSLSGQISLGFQGGLSLATLGGSDADLETGDEKSYRKGLSVGAFLAVPLSDQLSLQPELLYAQKGMILTDTEVGIEEEVELTLRLNYIEVPLLLRINVPTEGNIAPHFLVGPAIGFKASCELGVEEDGESFDVDCDEAEGDTKSIDFGGVIGAGVGIVVGPGEIVLGARYTLGLMSIDDSGEDLDIKNRTFSFLAGYSFPVGG